MGVCFCGLLACGHDWTEVPLAAEGVTRLIISPTTGDLAGQRDELSAFAERHGLG